MGGPKYITDFIAFDTETTGTVVGVDRIVEISVVKFVNGEPKGRFTSLVNPQRPMNPRASQVNGITDSMLKGQPLIEEVLREFTNFCGDLPLVAHNASFDKGFISSELERHEMPGPKGVILDSLKMARKAIPGLPSYKLELVLKHLDISLDQAHRAESDSIGCGHLLVEIIKRISKKGKPVEIKRLITLSGKNESYFPQPSNESKQMGITPVLKEEAETKTSYDNHGNHVVFYPGPHEYLLNNDPAKKMLSVTTLFKKYTPVFDGPAIAARIAYKRGKTPEALLAEWAATGEYASKLGTAVHHYAEVMLMAKDVYAIDVDSAPEDHKPFILSLRSFIPKLLEKLEFVESEKIIFDHQRRLSGTIDLLMRSKKTGNLVILDWKSNNKIDTQNDYGKKMLKSLSHLDDCKLVHYSLQLHAYKKIMKDCGYASDGQDIDLGIIHLNRIHVEKEGSTVVVSPKFIQVLDLEKEVSTVFEEGCCPNSQAS